MAKLVTPEMQRINAKRGNKEATYSFLKDAWRRLKRNRSALIGLAIIALFIFFAIFANLIAPYAPDESDWTALSQAPSAAHIFGTDELGRDLFSRCIYGTRYSLPIGLAAGAMSLAIGGIIGLLAAYFGGKADTILMRIMDIFQSIPAMILAIVVVATLGSGIIQLLIAMAISTMPSMAKVVRAAILTVRGDEFVEACRCIGSGNARLMFRHMVPNAVGFIIINAVSLIAGNILIVASLSYLGLGIPAPTPEWGSMLSAGKSYISTSPHIALFPGIMIMLTVLSFNTFGDGLRDALDPRMK